MMRCSISRRSRSDIPSTSARSSLGYSTDVDRDRIRAWWSLRCLSNIRWLVEHGFGPLQDMPEVAVLQSRP